MLCRIGHEDGSLDPTHRCWTAAATRSRWTNRPPVTAWDDLLVELGQAGRMASSYLGGRSLLEDALLEEFPSSVQEGLDVVNITTIEEGAP